MGLKKEQLSSSIFFSMKHFLLAIAILISASTLLQAQNTALIPPRAERTHKGKFFFFWGYNRSVYTNSDIQVKGLGYDFTAYNVKADDYPENFSTDVYFNIYKLTIPQFNFRLGYYIRERVSLSFGWDHLKYRVNHQQTVKIDGDYVKDGEVKSYDNEDVFLSREFFHLEHTDGLNFLRFNYDYAIPLIGNTSRKLSMDAIVGAGIGPVCPWTDAVLDGTRYRTYFRPAGAGVAANLTLRANLGGSFFLQTTGRVGGVKLIDVYIDPEIRGKQQFYYAEFNVTAGFTFGLKRKKK